MSSVDDRPLRRDAERNRRRILEAAGEVFAAKGISASFEDIARHADVAVGTVYRRFPRRELLIDALFEVRMGEVTGIIERAAEEPDAWTGLVTALEELLELIASDRAAWQLLMSDAHGGEAIACSRRSLGPPTTALVRRAQAQGAARPDLEPSDFPLMQLMLGSLVDATRDVDGAVWRRFLAIVLDGIRAEPGPASTLPAALPEEAVDAAMRASVTR